MEFVLQASEEIYKNKMRSPENNNNSKYSKVYFNLAE